MTDEQKAAYVHAQSVAAMAEIEGMKAQNEQRKIDGYLTMAYSEEQFMDIIDDYGLREDQLTAFFRGE